MVRSGIYNTFIYLFTINEVQLVVFTKVANVTGVVPATLVDLLACSGRIAKVALHRDWTTNEDLSCSVWSFPLDFLTLLVNSSVRCISAISGQAMDDCSLCFVASNQSTRRARLIALWIEEGCHPSSFRHAIYLADASILCEHL